jgi:hypothetical protein
LLGLLWKKRKYRSGGEAKMATEYDGSGDSIARDLTTALRLVRRWEHDETLNSRVMSDILFVISSLSHALENLHTTEAEIQQEEREELERREREMGGRNCQ